MKQETRFKGRTDTTAKRVARTAGVPLEFGHKSGDPDKMYRFRSVHLYIEHKRVGKSPRRLQELRLEALNDQGIPSITLSAAPDDNYALEKQEFYEAMLAEITPEKVNARLEQYREDAHALRISLQALLTDA